MTAPKEGLGYARALRAGFLVWVGGGAVLVASVVASAVTWLVIW